MEQPHFLNYSMNLKKIFLFFSFFAVFCPYMYVGRNTSYEIPEEGTDTLLTAKIIPVRKGNISFFHSLVISYYIPALSKKFFGNF